MLIEKLATFIKENNINIYKLSEVSDDHEFNIEIVKANRLQNAYSIAKVFTLTAIGIIYDNNKISLDDKLMDYFKDYEVVDSRFYDITIKDLIAHKAGFKANFLDIDLYGSYGFNNELDYLKYIFNNKLEYTPNSKYIYSDATYYLLARIVEKIVNKPVDIFLNEHLFSVFKSEEFAFSKTPLNHIVGASGLYINALDIARLGYIYLNEGKYKNKTILSKKFIDLVLDNNYELTSILNNKAYGKAGMNGQMMVIIPHLKLSISWLGYHLDNQKLLDYLANLI